MQTTTTNTTTPATTNHTATFEIDGSHSSATFRVRHMMISNVRGEFQKIAGTVTYDPARPEAAAVRATIDVASISTRDAQRDAHLRSPDFFDAEKHPQLVFVSRSLRRSDNGLELVGDLTIRGTTREVILAVDGPTPEHVDPWGNKRIGASASTSIKRSDFGMTWNNVLEVGGVLVGDEISIHLDVELIRKA